MSGPPLFLFIFFGVLVLITIIVAWYFTSKAIRESKATMHEKNDLKILYDQLRKEKFDLEDKLTQIQGQEKTYKVAYEDWKSKYSILEDKYQQIRREYDATAPEDFKALKSELQLLDKENESLNDKVKSLEAQLSQSNNIVTSTNSDPDSKIVSELKSVLDQHLAIISNIIGDEKMEQYTQKNIPADPLHLIKGINSETESKLIAQGVRSFDQIINTSKRDLKKWMLEFEDIDENIIESWPYQAEAIRNLKSMEGK